MLQWSCITGQTIPSCIWPNQLQYNSLARRHKIWDALGKPFTGDSHFPEMKIVRNLSCLVNWSKGNQGGVQKYPDIGLVDDRMLVRGKTRIKRDSRIRL